MNHTGKVSDKWSSYLDYYDRSLSDLRNMPIRMLEIGVQNGGSLEIWGKFFKEAEMLVGCDIDSTCNLLNYDDERISLVIGDICKSETIAEIFSKSDSFDLIIDDGSHTSSDIITTFLQLFPKVSDGGQYIIEDLHCSYWEKYEGGLYDPRSSISFLKKLIDLINVEHWGIEKTVEQFISIFKNHTNIDNIQSLYEEIESIEFVNSICKIQKRTKSEFTSIGLGERIITGKKELVTSGVSSLSGTVMSKSNESENYWSNLNCSIEEEREELQSQLLKTSKSLQVVESEINELKSSSSWLVTKPLRLASTYLNKLIPSKYTKFQSKQTKVKQITAANTVLSDIQFSETNSSKICIFAHFNSNSLVDDYVFHYLKELNKQGFDIVFVSTSEIIKEAQGKLSTLCKNLVIRQNIGYDFMSWKVGLDLIESKKINPDLILLANDSVYGPLFDLSNVFNDFKNKSVNIYGMTDSYEVDYHIQSYFIIFDKQVLESKSWKTFWKEIQVYDDKTELITNCEVGLTQRLMQTELKVDCFCKSSDVAHQAIIKQHSYYSFLKKNRAYNVTHLLWDVLILDFQFPFIKRELVDKNPLNVKTLTNLSNITNTCEFRLNELNEEKK